MPASLFSRFFVSPAVSCPSCTPFAMRSCWLSLRSWIVGGGVVVLVLVCCANAAGMTIAIKIAALIANLMDLMASSEKRSVTSEPFFAFR